MLVLAPVKDKFQMLLRSFSRAKLKFMFMYFSFKKSIFQTPTPRTTLRIDQLEKLHIEIRYHFYLLFDQSSTDVRQTCFMLTVTNVNHSHSQATTKFWILDSGIWTRSVTGEERLWGRSWSKNTKNSRKPCDLWTPDGNDISCRVFEVIERMFIGEMFHQNVSHLLLAF